MKVTIYDVAKEANVSIATVSNVINKKGRIGEKTRKRVHEAMEKLNYEPNMLASALTGKQTKTIGLIIPDLANPFFSELARSIEDRAHELSYNIVICSTDYQEEKENKYISLLKQKRVDGFILASGFENLERVQELMKEDIPVVIVARDYPNFSINAVALDDYMGGYQAANHLLQLGHKNIGFIALDVYSNRERIRGFKDALREHHIEPRKDLHFIEDKKQSLVKAGNISAIEYLESEEIPTAVFACNDLLAIGAIQAIKEAGLNVPDDISIVGFDNTSIATIVDPPLTTMSQPIQRMGREVMDLIISIFKGERDDEVRITLVPDLVKRKSTKEV
ncbi:LacI family DNA-binding transcriptional regulator [Oceanobacillus sp. Castelsardo]|uniref:LacI family DNA-binding transcriptional regulator n=1 Tax=Oceanobacillus sp. Castelsardo TaxID=1851204 RepID=UPI0008397508|nr:LacI family DNA-binding transcriptional regulator [Oceanobacillus sp. Castelsardo]